MTNSHILGLSLFATFAFFAIVAVVKAGWDKNLQAPGMSRRALFNVALLLVIVGAIAGWGAFTTDNRMRITTLHEEVVEGSLNQKINTPAPTRTVTFKVEHPQVQHTLAIWPESDSTPDFTAKIHLRLVDQDGHKLLEDEAIFKPEWGTGRNAKIEWRPRSYSFTPQHAALHILDITPVTVDIPRIHVYITDPQKRNGARLPGY
jgi:hypothetical protein